MLASNKRNSDDELSSEMRVTKKHKMEPLAENNSLGLFTPPTTPEKRDRVMQLELKTGGKALNLLREEKLLSPYSVAKSLFVRGSQPTSTMATLTAREKEGSQIREIIESGISTGVSNSVYISGPPGTGKTAQVSCILQDIITSNMENSSPVSKTHSFNGRTFKVINVNCMTIKTSNDLFVHLYFQLTSKRPSGNVNVEDVSRLLSQQKNKPYTIIVLDEMDNIVKSSEQALYELFTCASPKKEDCSLLLIGIANALDLTDRFLPRLKSNCIDPKIIRFLPYTANQIKEIITDKLISFQSDKEPGTKIVVPPMVAPNAIVFCSRKAAVNTGDLRNAFDIMYQSLDSFEQSVLQSQSIEHLNKKPLSELPKMSLTQVVKVCTRAFTINYQEKINHLNFQQRIVLGFLFKFEEKYQKSLVDKKNSDLGSINAFFEYYTKRLQSMDKVTNALKRSEFLEIITALETQSMVTLTFLSKSSKSSQTTFAIQSANQSLNFGSFKISSNLPKNEFIKSTKDIEILEKIMKVS